MPFPFGNFSYSSVLRVSLYSKALTLRKRSYDSSAFMRLEISASVKPLRSEKHLRTLNCISNLSETKQCINDSQTVFCEISSAQKKNPYLFFKLVFSTVLYNKTHIALIYRFTLPACTYQSSHFVDSWLHPSAFSKESYTYNSLYVIVSNE
jgi:hypothetical protein